MTVIIDKNASTYKSYKEIINTLKSYTKEQINDFKKIKFVSFKEIDNPELFYTELGIESQIENIVGDAGFVFHFTFNQSGDITLVKTVLRVKFVEDD